MQLVPLDYPAILDKNYDCPRIPNLYLQTRLGLAKSTVQTYANCLLHWLNWLEGRGQTFDKATCYDILEYFQEQTCSNSTKRYKYGRLVHFYAWAETQGVKSPIAPLTGKVQVLRFRCQRKAIRLVTLKEADTFIHAFGNKRDRLIAAVMMYCGLRRAEVLGLCMSSFERPSPADKMVRFSVIGKGGKQRKLLMPMELYLKLRDLKREHLFPVHLDTVNKAFKVNSKKTGIRINPHLLRHIYASSRMCVLERNNAKRGTKNSALKTLQIELGHSSIETTSLYIHLIEPERVPETYQEWLNEAGKDLTI